MLANSLILGLFTYTAAVVYNLLAQKSLETVFYSGVKFLLYTTLMTLFLQLSFYLVKNYNSKDDSEAENNAAENISKTEPEEKTDNAESDKQEFEESAVENEFDNEEFSALNQEEFDYQQNNNQ